MPQKELKRMIIRLLREIQENIKQLNEIGNSVHDMRKAVKIYQKKHRNINEQPLKSNKNGKKP